ncbi:TIGR03643 family protein [Coraliomargarita sinensis]|uniref:TIGR03643 family protein n=1 Tax=Coraliomargarita sinensis TaxID=2174842 RepID=A0A317ZJ79_9BACT|nr:TIGR03643 family protein [Coraliomargarita sinensis]PXA05042.1 TIGR03643 family protein [Coraliomargarita sinensis]
MTKKHKKLSAGATDRVIGMAWQDRCSFERIEDVSGLTEPEVIKLMRANLKPSSFRRWRKRVSGRVTKHRKRFKRFEAFKGSFE